jgi:hypothetical protein
LRADLSAASIRDYAAEIRSNRRASQRGLLGFQSLFISASMAADTMTGVKVVCVDPEDLGKT